MKNILIIQVNVDSAEMLSMLLQLQGHLVKCAYSGHEALLLARQLIPDVVIIDLGLPDMDGFEIVRKLASDAWAARCVFVALTGRDTVEIRRRAQEAGINHFFVKGDEIPNLLSIVIGEHLGASNSE